MMHLCCTILGVDQLRKFTNTSRRCTCRDSRRRVFFTAKCLTRLRMSEKICEQINVGTMVMRVDPEAVQRERLADDSNAVFLFFFSFFLPHFSLRTRHPVEQPACCNNRDFSLQSSVTVILISVIFGEETIVCLFFTSVRSSVRGKQPLYHALKV